jgi:hypothetical protein
VTAAATVRCLYCGRALEHGRFACSDCDDLLASDDCTGWAVHGWRDRYPADTPPKAAPRAIAVARPDLPERPAVRAAPAGASLAPAATIDIALLRRVRSTRPSFGRERGSEAAANT